MKFIYTLLICFFIVPGIAQLGIWEATPERLQSGINSSFPEFSPIISPDEKTLFFSRKSDPLNIGTDNQSDIWITQYIFGDEWTRAVNAGLPLNDRRSNQIVAINATGDVIYGVSDQLWRSEKEGRDWGRPLLMAIENMDDMAATATYHVSSDEKTLIFSNRNEGQDDLYIAFRVNEKTWSAPRLLSKTINTSANESHAFLAVDGKTLIFASDRSEGRGGFDLYVSKRTDDTWNNWTTPQNLGAPVNTAQDDIYFSTTANGEYGFFVGKGEQDDTDIYKIRLPEFLRPQATEMGKSDLTFPESYQSFSSDEGMTFSNQKEKMYASGSSDFDYEYDDPVVTDLQLRLKKLDSDLLALQKLRDQSELDRKEKRLSFENAYRSDPELEALKHRYESLYVQPNQPIEENENVEKEVTADSELDKMKQQFNQHYRTSEPADYLWEGTAPRSFSDLQKEVYQELSDKLEVKVKNELFIQSEKEIASELLSESDEVFTSIFSKKIRYYFAKSQQTLLKKWQEDNYLKMITDTAEDVKPIRNDLERLLEEDVKRKLRSSLKDEVRAEMRWELRYLVKQELQKQLEHAIQERVLPAKD